MYGTEVSPSLISGITGAVSEEVEVWQSHALDELYPILYLDCIHVELRDNGAVRTKAVYFAIGVNMDGRKEVLGLWIAKTEGAKFWLQVELKTRGLEDIFNRLRGRAQGLSRGDLSGLSVSLGSTVYRAHSAQQLEVHIVEVTTRSRCCPQAYLPFNDG